jgi:hypothetical protein
MLGKSCDEDRRAARVGILVADLADTAGDHIVDKARVQVVAVDERPDDRGVEIRGVDPGECTARLALA